MPTQADYLTQGLCRDRANKGGPGRLLWRTALGQATLDLLTAGQPVTAEALIKRIEASIGPDDLLHKKASIEAALEVLRPLADPERYVSPEP